MTRSTYMMLHLFKYIVVLLLLVSCGTARLRNYTPEAAGSSPKAPEIIRLADTAFSYQNNFLLKNKQQLWELYIEGDALERGMIAGALSEPLIRIQERVFFDKVEEIVPSKSRQKLLRQFLKWYNRKLDTYVTEEFKTEIYGLSRYTSHEYDRIAPPYLRSLYLHGAHDIGHALQDLALVGCTSFAVWDEKSEDGSLLIGRNFDFYAGDEFARNKVISFVRPDSGYPFMSVTWGGMIGVVSGMNLEGLTVTINAGKSSIPVMAKTPVSLVTREILQYAKNIDEAIAIARKKKVFVSESIMVGSASDHKAVLIEISPENFGLYEVPNAGQLICSNHFQSQAYATDKKNTQHILESHSKYRYDRMSELLTKNDKINPEKAAAILRNKEGLKDLPIGYGNEKALNQLLAHHGIIFKPEQRKVWVSANPYQLGAFVAYDLNEVFSKTRLNMPLHSLADTSLTIRADPFLNSPAYKAYEEYRKMDRLIDLALKNKQHLEDHFIREYQASNPELWLVYYKAGLYFYQQKNYGASEKAFEKALTKEITTLPGKTLTEKYLKKTRSKLN